jgi:hypothetical protein
MKALSLTRPLATLAALGEKGWKTRSRRVHHYGSIAIHSSACFPNTRGSAATSGVVNSPMS